MMCYLLTHLNKIGHIIRHVYFASKNRTKIYSSINKQKNLKAAIQMDMEFFENQEKCTLR